MDLWSARDRLPQLDGCGDEPEGDGGHPAVHKHLVHAEDRSGSSCSNTQQTTTERTTHSALQHTRFNL